MEKRIKIMHIAQAYPGGVPVYIESLVQHLDKNKFENILVCSHAYEEERFAPHFSAIEKVGMERSISVSKILKPAFAIRKLIKKHKPDVIYCHSSIAGAVGRIAAIGCGAKVIYNAHSWAFNMRISKKKKMIFLFIEKVLALFTDKIICVSQFEKDCALRNRVCSENKIKVILNGVDIDSIQKTTKNPSISRKDLNIPEDAYVIGMVGRICEQKAPDVFVNVAKRIKDVLPNAFFIIVGDGPDQASIEKKISDLMLSNSFFITGWVKKPYEYLALFDQAVLLSRWEAFGLALAEYMAAQKPIVCTNADAMPEIVANRVTGLVVDIDDEASITDAILFTYQNPDKKKEMINRAFEAARNLYSISKEAASTASLFCQD